jgi:hypothetical protein
MVSFSFWYCVGAAVALGVLGCGGAAVAEAKGRAASTGFWLGFWLGPLGIVIAALLPTPSTSRASSSRELRRPSRPVPLKTGYEFPSDCIPEKVHVYTPEEDEAAGWLAPPSSGGRGVRPL